MKTYLKLAFRNVLRYKKRTIITFCTIAFGLGMMAVGISLYGGVDKQAMTNVINTQTGHLKIYAEGYFDRRDDFPLDQNITNPEQVISILREIKEVTAVESRIAFMASLINGVDELPCTGVAIDTASQEFVFDIRSTIVEGEFLEPDEPMMLIGSDLARDLMLKVGDTCVIRMFTSTEDFVWNALDLEVKGIFQTDNPQVNMGTIFIPLSIARGALSLDKEVTEIAIRLTSREIVDPLKEEISAALTSHSEQLEVVTYKEQMTEFLEMLKMRSQAQALFPLIMLLIATLGIVNTMLMAVLERVREIGMLQAMGMKRWDIMKLFILEGAFIGFFGSIVGCIIGALGGWYLEVKGFNMGGLGQEVSDMIASVYPARDVFYGDLTLGVLVFTLVFGTVVSILASLYPAYRAVKIDPIKALRHV
ncbi:ABC transporter permease [Acidobacteriota bacterium]